MATLSQELAKFAYNLKYEDIPERVIEKIKTLVLHGICVGLAGYNLDSVKLARKAILANPSNAYGEATVLGNGAKASVMDAAFATSIMFLSRVQADTHGVTHTGPVCIPLALALAEKEKRTGKELITALTAAYEIMGALGKDYTKLSAERGFRASSIYGIFGTATVAGLLLNLSEEELAHALGFAASFAFGTTESLAQGTMEWRYQEGVAARNGMIAALLAKEGAIAAPTALEGNKGFYKAFAGVNENLNGITANFGKVWETLNALIKLYPTCIQNNSHVHNAINLAVENDIDPTNIKSILVEMNSFESNYPGHRFWGPFVSQGQTLNSVPFCVSISLLDRRLNYDDLLLFEDPRILKMVNRVQVEGKDDVNLLCSRITVEMEDGKIYTRKLDVTEEFYNLDYKTDVEMIRKMADEIPLTMEQIDGLIETIANLETVTDVDQLIQWTTIR